MLPVINATQALLPKGLIKRVCDRIQEPTPLAHVERDLAVGDPAILRGVIFELLRTGRLRAPSLHHQPLALHLMVGPS